MVFNPPAILLATYHETLHAREDETWEEYMERCRKLMAEYNNC